MVKELTMGEVFLVEDFPITVARRDPQPPYPRHKHVFTELVIVLRGAAIHVVDDVDYPIGQGDVFVIAGNREHEFKKMDDLALINVIFEQEQLALKTWDTGDLPGFRTLFFLEPEYRRSHRFESRLRVAGSDLTVAAQLAAALEEELQDPMPGYRLKATGLLMELLVHLSRCYESVTAPQTQSLMRIADAINYIEAKFHQPIRLAELSEIACMSDRSFQRAFKRAMGRSPKDYLVSMRIKKAQYLLESTELPIGEVAAAVGFDDGNYFSRQFRRALNVSPREYRKLNQNG